MKLCDASDIVGIKDSYILQGNSKNYYLSMYGDNYNGKDKVTQSHNAYLRKNNLI
jgi:hypothetical protein